ncbi:hypothetical protein P154DRAFT_211655 [Amniculicola lignicola CBS 123094]|uniref:Uncharacterized protein n=1 Tax=Amniculicola lignicola CBS 123094 TaxID=1392246 RepID=A0A6A5WFT8_9PLEO|nr:hypothetical protein P154DRAFT_211655 [Amniculicola lignicola CBS 123094]
MRSSTSASGPIYEKIAGLWTTRQLRSFKTFWASYQCSPLSMFWVFAFHLLLRMNALSLPYPVTTLYTQNSKNKLSVFWLCF